MSRRQFRDSARQLAPVNLGGRPAVKRGDDTWSGCTARRGGSARGVAPEAGVRLPALWLRDRCFPREASALPDVRSPELAQLEEALVTRSRRELHDWYTSRLRPKLLHAAGAGSISVVRAAELERQMQDLIRDHPSRRGSARTIGVRHRRPASQRKAIPRPGRRPSRLLGSDFGGVSGGRRSPPDG
jgi:hypothetical protein